MSEFQNNNQYGQQQYQQQAPQYQPQPPMPPMPPVQPMPQYPMPMYQPMSVGEWVGTIILGNLGLIGLIFLFIWAFGDSTRPEKKNFAKAELIIIAIVLGLVILLWLIFGLTFAAILSQF